MELTSSTIERQLVDALPELKPAAEAYWEDEGQPGEDSGPYIFFENMFGCYVEILLAMRTSPRRDELLRRAFAFVEEMLACGDQAVRDLAFVGMYEGRDAWWLAQATPFLGVHATRELDTWSPGWRESSSAETSSRVPGLFDIWGVRNTIAKELAIDGLTIDDIPGRTTSEA